ncbi:MAG: DUF4124 domain-containing protein [Nitrospiria bacterium]
MNQIILILLGLLVFSPGEIQAKIYKYTDNNGVTTLTDTLAKVPPEYRKDVEVLGESDLAPPTPDSFPTFTTEKRSRLKRQVGQWFDPSKDRNILIATSLAFLLLFFVSRNVGGFLFKYAFLLSGVALLGSILYSFVIPREIYLKQSSSEQINARISNKVKTIQKARKLNEDLAKKEHEHENIFQSIFQKDK